MDVTEIDEAIEVARRAQTAALNVFDDMAHVHELAATLKYSDYTETSWNEFMRLLRQMLERQMESSSMASRMHQAYIDLMETMKRISE